MTQFELRISGVKSDRSADCDTANQKDLVQVKLTCSVPEQGPLYSLGILKWAYIQQ